MLLADLASRFYYIAHSTLRIKLQDPKYFIRPLGDSPRSRIARQQPLLTFNRAVLTVAEYLELFRAKTD